GICGLDTGKRHIIHFLEPRKDGVHGGIILTAAGNTVQILTLAPFSTENKQRNEPRNAILERRYLFGFGGGGIGSLAVHPSKRFFAVGEKGIKPNITIYRYPSAKVCGVLRNGTEFSYSSVVFSQDGEKLASVGGAPDYLLTVWNWRQQQTILRCKAFGQDVFSVQFAPNDSGFLTTSGVGHIRMWRMASTFTGLKLQGDIGKFGKSELSDIEAFCVLPDKKVLSGTERGVLLLWDGNFIKCEVLTSRRHAPHNGAINVVDYDPEEGQIVTAGKDGYVRFWSFDTIDRADAPPDDTVALVPMKKQILIEPLMDIRSVIKESGTRYLIQDGRGSVHLLVMEGEESYVELSYLPNKTGRVTGIACSPYEHLAASCGEDGSIRAWNYVKQQFLFGTVTSSSSASNAAAERGSTLVPTIAPAAATSITWVPTSGALITEQIVKSRQVAVGFSDGLVRVFLMDLVKRIWVRTNVFKPHHERVTCLSYSTSGHFFATASDDHTFFIFKIVPNAKTSKFSKYPPEYEPLGFQRVPSSVRSLCWRSDDAALLVTLGDGQVIEFLLSENGLAPKERSASMSPRMDDAATESQENESYELHLESREYSPFQRSRIMTVKEMEALEALNPTGNPQVEEKIRNNFQVEMRTPSPLAWTAMYASNDTIYLSCQSPFHGALYMYQYGNPTPLQEFASEESGHIVGVALSSSKKVLLCGLSNGKFQLRSASKPHAFLTGEFHDYSTYSSGASESNGKSGRLQLALSFDDSFVLAAGCDGNLSICRLHHEKLELSARILSDKYDKLLAEANIVGDQAMEKQKTQVDLLQKALADGKNNEDDTGNMTNAVNSLGNELTSLPSFHRAKAYSSYVGSKLEASDDSSPPFAQDDEIFQGVVRLVSDPDSEMGLDEAASPLDDKEAPTGSLLNLLEVPDIQNPKDAYTIEDAKLKSEADAKANTTKSKQDRTRDVVQYMRKQLQELKALNATYPPESRLDDGEWEIDLDYGELLTKMGDAACEEVRKELAYAVEREELLLMKMRETYVSPLAVELITLHAFENGLSVRSFRTMKMPVVLQKRLNEIHTNDLSEARHAPKKGSTSAMNDLSGAKNNPAAGHGVVLRKPSVLHIMAKNVPLDDEFPLKEEERKMIQSGGSLKTGVDQGLPRRNSTLGKLPPGAPVSLQDASASNSSSSSSSVHGFEARKRLRADRKDRLTQWMNSKPGEDADDPRDIVAIAFAQRNMGDYKLKSAPNYVVPEEQRVNAAKKRRQMALLEEKLYEARLGFNAKVLELRELKLLLINELKHDQARLVELYEALALEERHATQKKALEIDLREWPEQRERVSDADIETFLREKKVLPHSTATSFLQTTRGRVGSISSGSGDQNGSSSRNGSMNRSIVTLSRKLQISSEAIGAAGSAANGTLEVRHLCLDELSSVPLHSFTNITTKEGPPKQKNMDADDAAVRVYLMKQEIVKIERKKQDEIRAFDDAIAHLRREKMKLEVILKKCELRLFTLLSELVLLEQFENKENLLSSKLDKSKGEKAQIVAEINEIQENLSNKKKEHEEWSKQEKAIQSEFLTTVNGNNGSTQHPNFAALQKIFKKKIKRPKKKPGAMEELKKSNERQVAKQRQIDKELQATEHDIQQFQSEKQTRFNQLDVVVALSKHQIRCLEARPGGKWEVPEQSANCLVFTMQSFDNLAERIDSLQKENKSLRQQFKDLHKQQNLLAKEKKVQEEAIADIQHRCEQLQLLKFGQLVDIEVLDKACDTTKLNELQAKVRVKEIESEREMFKVKQSQQQLKLQILQATEQNTALLSRIAELNERQFALERELNQANVNQSVLNDDTELLEQEMRERNKLVKLVKLQSREVEALKQEIGLLRGKDGKVYAPRM
uniref:EML-like first beta-propeller domain-containing protein n=1 Tax=Globisporangium ultimum (strain ATCC 200006 / CBS 805.95 / DAOM BR144) TaxID=431595 RepID=K3X7R6_GLOUD